MTSRDAAPWNVHGPTATPYMIAEIGVNHGGDLALAKEYVRQASAAGFDAVKFQSYRAATLAAEHSPAYWDLSEEPTTSQRELFAKYDALQPADYAELAALAHELGVDFSSTPFDLDYVAELAPIADFFKIASADITNIPLLRAVGATRLPVVLSTGGSEYAEIEAALDELRASGSQIVAILHCVLNYPTVPSDAQLNQIPILAAMFPSVTIGYSDHVPPQDSSPYALEHVAVSMLMGARIIEKHFTLDRGQAGNDHYHAADPSTMEQLNHAFTRIAALRGRMGPKSISGESDARKYARRGLYAARFLARGQSVGARDVIVLRPADGSIPAQKFDEVLGRTLVSDVDEGQALSWEMFG